MKVLAADNGFSFVMTDEGDAQEANNHFARMRRLDKEDYARR